MAEEDTWRELIRINYTFFKKNISYPNTSNVADYLYSKEIVTFNDKEAIQSNQITTAEKVGKLLDILLKRGPRVPDLLYEALKNTDQPECAEKLAPYLLAQAKKDLQENPSEWSPLDWNPDSIKVTCLRPNDPCYSLKSNSKDVYSMKRKRRGLVFLINNELFHSVDPELSRREGTIRDGNSLKKLFEELHFEVIPEKDLTAQEIKDKTRYISTCDMIKISDCFIFIILTHGNEKGVFGTDGITVPVKTLVEMFEPKSCPELNEKPKIFFVQACRGEKKEMVAGSGDNPPVSNLGTHQLAMGNTSDIHEANPTNTSATSTAHSNADLFVAYSTPESSLSWRNTGTGSWFVQAIVWVLRNEAYHSSLTEMMTKVNLLVSKRRAWDELDNCEYMTVSMHESTLRKTLYFFPGIQENN